MKKLRTDAPLWAATIVLMVSILVACYITKLKM